MKKKVLIGLFGLSRTFKYTSKFLFERIINPNSNEYTFDIIINTDFENSSTTYGRGENGSSTALYKYDDIDLFKTDLNKFYNAQNNLKDIIIYNKDKNVFIFPWFIVYKRIQQILQKSFENNDIYDIYIMMRMDIIVDNIINLNDIDNEIIFISSIFVRNAYLHNRDIDYIFYGNYKPIMMWVYNMINLYQNITNKNDETKNYFDNKNICCNILLNEFDILKQNLHFDNDDINKIANQVNIKHTNDNLCDNYILNNNIVQIDINNYYDIEYDFLLKNILYNIKLILCCYNFYLSENRNKIHSDIIR
jgi:hypothetical protein